MKYKVTDNENVSTVFLTGEIDMDVADEVREIVFPLIDAGKEVHLNLKDVPYMDSSGISIIIESNQRAREKNTKVELKEVSQPVEKVLAMASLCLCPPESCTPLSPIIVSNPSLKLFISSKISAFLAASIIFWLSIVSLEKAIFSLIVPENK